MYLKGFGCSDLQLQSRYLAALKLLLSDLMEAPKIFQNRAAKAKPAWLGQAKRHLT